YGPEECYKFHKAILSEAVPLVRFLNLRKATVLDLGRLRPWDTKIASTGNSPASPFSDSEEMLDKSIAIFERIDPGFGEFLGTMKKMSYLDLDSRIGKAPGGYNCRMPESGVPFIFMNASGSTGDVKTMMHEGGHAVHSFLSRDLKLNGFKEMPSEISELASMAMEFFSYDHWDLFYPDQEDLRLARIEFLERTVVLFPWVACIDSFQHWLYTNPEHTVAEREAEWNRIHHTYASSVTDWDDMEHYRGSLWQAQLHLFKVPFYYIEYAIARLGSIALWRNYKIDPAKTLRQYREALSLGYTRTIGETYEAAGIKFDFSSEYVQELVAFVKAELQKLYRD
ncbi:MAG: oligoendopeptidase F, partial [Limisphaerales bacterium]